MAGTPLPECQLLLWEGECQGCGGGLQLFQVRLLDHPHENAITAKTMLPQRQEAAGIPGGLLVLQVNDPNAWERG